LRQYHKLYWVLATAMRRRADQTLIDKAHEFSALLSSQGLAALRDEIDREARAEGTDEVLYRLLSRDGRVVASSATAYWPGAPVSPRVLAALRPGEPVLESVRFGRRQCRVAYVLEGSDSVLQLTRSTHADERLLEDFREGFAVAMVAVLILGCAGGWFMATRALRGVAQLTDAAREISGAMLDRRVPVRGTGDEIDRLAATFNAMLDRIQALVAGMRQVTDDVAHDLRTPISRIRGAAEVALNRTRSPEELQQVLADTIEECDRLLATLNTMLEISEAQAGALKLDLVPLDLSELVREVGELFEPAAVDKGIAFETHVRPTAIVQADRQRLSRVIANLLDNAVKYTPPGGRVCVSTEGDERRAVLSVSDTGTGISEEDLPHIFERFYRGDRSRSQQGTGLGLSLVQAVVRAHDGDVRIDSAVGKGTVVRVVLPGITKS